VGRILSALQDFSRAFSQLNVTATREYPCSIFLF